MNDELKRKLKDLRLGGLLAHWDEYLKLAADQRFSHAHLLSFVLEEEWRIKRENARQRRIKQAGIPEPLAIETYPFHKQPKLNKKKIMALYDSLSFVTNKENIIWLGRTWRGKTDRLTETSHVFNMKECVGIRPRRNADEPDDHELGADQ
jgi:hypothetical protein